MVKFAGLKKHGVYIMPAVLPVQEWTNAKGIPFYINEPEAMRPGYIVRDWGTSMRAGRIFVVKSMETVGNRGLLKKAVISYIDKDGNEKTPEQILDTMFAPNAEFVPVEGVVEGAKQTGKLKQVAKQDMSRLPPNVLADIGSFLTGQKGPLGVQYSKADVAVGRPGVSSNQLAPQGGRRTRRRKTAHKKRKTVSKRK